jgi:peptide/nickel transport system substrate-binding protein
MTLTIHFKDFYPSILVGGFWTAPIPRHYYEGIPINEMAADEKTRATPIGFGPFKIKNVVPGESVEFERYDDYWMGKPKLDGITVTVVNPELVPTAMQEGRFDVATFSVQQYPNYKNPTNYQYIGEVQTVFSYTGFKLGKWDAEKNENIYDANTKMANVKLRQAIGYAVDNATLGETFYNGLRFLATTVITPRHSAYQNKEMTGFVYDPEKAKQLLDEAGYKDVDGDGFREDPKGEQFTITWATMEGENAETYAQFKMQCWAEVGLRVELFNGRLTEFNAFYEAVEMDDPAIDMYDGAWQTGYDPNPDALWGRLSSANYTRYTSDTFDAITDDISSDKAWDNAFLAQRYKDWQQAFFDEAPAIPTLWRVAIDAVNNRVKNYELTASDIKLTAHLIELTAEEPMK